MRKFLLFTTEDRVAEVFGAQTWTALSIKDAERSFIQALNDDSTPMGQHKADYNLYDRDWETGIFSFFEPSL